ncbi:UDP-N-acetylglucosamine transferase subunit ALG14 homolog [Dendronephthya gigantea]|uniref:UDP-N-acetylglucosamine transferase subunit ALG14 homolog n=1 Tax=Dendronephthya gigantea TaxID=151771 RepID=UPI00106B9978|nr:UDP-N-acetylglucosamine transferase subunit ALG14 homolog [Dendronephthya gigantea]
MLVLFSVFCSITCIFVVRIYWVLVRKRELKKEKVDRFVKTMIVAGSGGHTKEMLLLLKGLSRFYYPRIYVVADTDTMSSEKIENFEQKNKYKIEKIPRSREVHQSWSSTVITTLKSIIFSFPLVFRHNPQLILCNGPGTCIPICFAAFMLKVFGIQTASVIYIESICRVETLSLSAKILYYFADKILVQWRQLEKKYPRTLHLGRLV